MQQHISSKQVVLAHIHDQTTLKALLDYLNLSQYADTLDSEGYERVEDLSDATSDEFVRLGMKNPHAKRVLKHFASFKRTQTAAIGEEERQAINQMVASARDHLNKFASAKTFLERERSLSAMGRHEALFTNFKLAALDTDGNGRISDSEVDQFYTGGASLVEAYLGSLINSGVVGALILSIIYPMAYESVPVENPFGSSRNLIPTLKFLCLQVSVSLSHSSLFDTAFMYTQMSFFMPTTKAQLWYIRKEKHYMQFLESMKSATIVTSACSLGLHIMAACTEKVGRLSTHGAVFSIIWFFPVMSSLFTIVAFMKVVLNSISAYLQQSAKEMMQSDLAAAVSVVSGEAGNSSTDVKSTYLSGLPVSDSE